MTPDCTEKDCRICKICGFHQMITIMYGEPLDVEYKTTKPMIIEVVSFNPLKLDIIQEFSEEWFVI